MSIFDDLLPELENGKKCHEYIYSKDVPQSAQEVTDQCSFNIEWYSEPMPLENSEGNAFEKEVRQMICESCYREDVPEMPSDAPPQKEDVLVFADQGGFCQRMLDRAPEGRIASKKVVTKPAGMITVDDLESLLASKSWDMVIIGCTLDPPKSNTVAHVLEQQNAIVKFCFLFLQVCYRKEGCCKRLAVLTNDVFSEQEDTHMERGLSITTNGTMYGMMNTARQEMEMPIQLIDVELTDSRDLVPHVASEVFRISTFGMNTVRHCYPYEIKNGKRTNRPAGRYVVRQVTTNKYQEARVKFELPAEGVIAISGGNGALGLVMGNWLLDTAEKEMAASGGAYIPKFTIQFLSRSAKVSDLNITLWKTVEQKAAKLGITAEQSRLDMGTQEAVDEYVARVSPHLIGFIHSAGILQDSMIPNQTWEKFEAVFASKHWAALYLHDALERFPNPNLKFYWMFSSSSVYGSMGQINYSASNSYMDALARHRVALGMPALAIQWGAWGEVGMAANLDEVMRRRVMMGPVPYFSVKQGLQGMEEGLRTGLPGVTVMIINPMVYFGMIQGDAGTTARYSRNFSSEYVPTPPPSSFATDQTYNIYRMYRYIIYPYSNSEPLVWTKYIRPKVKVEPEDEGVVVELGYGLA